MQFPMNGISQMLWTNHYGLNIPFDTTHPIYTQASPICYQSIGHACLFALEENQRRRQCLVYRQHSNLCNIRRWGTSYHRAQKLSFRSTHMQYHAPLYRTQAQWKTVPVADSPVTMPFCGPVAESILTRGRNWADPWPIKLTRGRSYLTRGRSWADPWPKLSWPVADCRDVGKAEHIRFWNQNGY